MSEGLRTREEKIPLRIRKKGLPHPENEGGRRIRDLLKVKEDFRI